MTTPSTFCVSLSRAAFDRVAAQLARTHSADLLLSADGYPSHTDSVVGIAPVLELILSPSTTKEDIRKFCFATPGPVLGFVSYTYGMLLRGIPSDKPADFPLGHLKKYAATLTFDGQQAQLQTDSPALLNELRPVLEQPPKAEPAALTLPSTPPILSLDQQGYEDGVTRTLEAIRSGHTYQLNLSTRFSWRSVGLDPLGLFLGLHRAHPAPFYAWLRTGHQRIISTSPERFLRVRNGEVLSQPIKGTLAVDESEPDHALLTESPKESAELSMIVDLIRNDIAANCEYGSVRVTDHKSVFQVDDLLQMYSNVRGQLRNGRDCLDLFLDAFPGGSITGCPKKSSMGIIERLEPHSRGVYCGSVVHIRSPRDMDSSIAIRTATYDTRSGDLNTYAGSGIVVDSKPASEYQETMAKARKFLASGAA